MCIRDRPEEVLFHGPIDRPVYLSSKVTGVASVEALGTFKAVSYTHLTLPTSDLV